jgi:heme-degrading monooxygenase HmoA
MTHDLAGSVPDNEEVVMAVAMVMEAPGMTAELYDSVMEHLEWSEQDLPDGFISHYAGPTEDGMLVFDIWESQEDFERFLESRLGAALAAATGGQAPAIEPRFIQIHNQDHARSRV